MMYRVKKIKIRLTKSQMCKCSQIFGINRFLYNKFIEMNHKEYNKNKRFVFANDFNKYVTHVLAKEYPWIKECPSKARREVIRDAEKGLQAFFNGTRGFIRFKSKKSPVRSFYFIKNGIRFLDQTHLWIPILHSIKLCEKDYLINEDIQNIVSGRILEDHGEFYVILRMIKEPQYIKHKYSDGIGVDLGIKSFATLFSNGKCIHISNINHVSKNIKNCEDKIIKLQKIISHKENVNLKKRGYKDNKNIKKGEATDIYNTHSIKKLRHRIYKLKRKISRIRKDYILKLCNSMVIAKPLFITIEDLSVINMHRENGTTLNKHIQDVLLRFFRERLVSKCEDYLIELRIAHRYFASSKTCCMCGHIKKSLQLNDRIYKCEKCGNKIDRDENASINLYKTKHYDLI